MKCSEVIQKLTELAPEALACEWDNPGLLIGRGDRSVSRILIVLDVTEKAVDYAIRSRAEMIVSHHPMIFHGMKKINSDDVFGRRIMKLIRSDISVFAMHTNYDAAADGMGAQAGRRLGLLSCEALADAVSYRDCSGETVYGGIGCIGTLPAPLPIGEFCQLVKERFDLEQLLLFGGNDGRMISRVALCPGSGKDYIGAALDRGADIYVSGDIGHHAGIDAWEQGLPVADAGHYGLEHIFTEVVERYLSDCVTADVELMTMADSEPFHVM